MRNREPFDATVRRLCRHGPDSGANVRRAAHPAHAQQLDCDCRGSFLIRRVSLAVQLSHVVGCTQCGPGNARSSLPLWPQRAHWSAVRARTRSHNESLVRGCLRCSAGDCGFKIEMIEGRQRAAVQSSGESGAASVSDLEEAEFEPIEACQPSRRRRQRTCRRRRRHEGGEALVTDRIALEVKMVQRGQSPQGRCKGHHPRVSDGRFAQTDN
eukprot:scaffold115598_cov60-Phaeocystis_antarctica.AAC.4